MRSPTRPSFALVESNTTGTGRQFCAAAINRRMRPVVLAVRPGRYPYLAQDGVDVVVVDTSSTSAVLEACRELDDLAGVASSSEYFAATAAQVAARLGLPAADARALTRCRHKDRQRAALSAAGVPVPAFRAVADADDAVGAALDIGLPVVVKPTTGSGSAGVRRCDEPADVARHAAALLAATRDERGNPIPRVVLIEEYLRGAEYSVETFDAMPVAVVAKHLGDEPFFVETGHDCPAPVEQELSTALGRTARAAVRALAVSWGAAHTELRVTERGPVVVEVNPRLAGGLIPVLVRLAHGVDLVDAVVAKACGEVAPTASRRRSHTSIRFIHAPASGVVVEIAGVPLARRSPGVAMGEVTASVGDELRLTNSFRDRVGHVVAVAEDARTAAERASRAASLIRIGTRPTA